MVFCVFRMVSQAEKWDIGFFVATRVSVPAIVLLTHAIRDQSVTITQMSQGDADAEKSLERLVQMKYHRGDVPPGAAGRRLRGHHDYC